MFISLEFTVLNINKLLYLIHFKTVVIILSSFRFLSRGKIGAPRPFGNWELCYMVLLILLTQIVRFTQNDEQNMSQLAMLGASEQDTCVYDGPLLE